MKRRLFTCLVSLVLIAAFGAPALAAPPTFTVLQPGQTTTFEQTVPLNLVFIGYDMNTINTQTLLDQLPATYDPVVRYPQFYGLPGRDLGLLFNYEYNVVDANADYEQKFFNYLRSIGTTGDPTLFQQEYNNQANNVRDVEGPVLYIDAPSVEGWLQREARGLLRPDPQQAYDPEQSYTVYLINWYSRPDFQFHVYTKTDEVDPDTGYNFGAERESRKMIAWGGSAGRNWFYDLSAGPEAWSGNYNVDDADLDGDNEPDYRIPPIWEYGDGGYRALSELSKDLGLVTRYVGINLLFTSSPLYDPLVTAPGLRGGKIVQVELFEDDPNTSGREFIDGEFILTRLKEFQPYYRWQVNIDDQPIDEGAERALNIFAGLIQPTAEDCASQPPYDTGGSYFGALFCYFNENLDKYVPAYGPDDYVGEVFAFNVDDTLAEQLGGLLGYADDNWVDGTQTYVFEFDAPFLREVGYGFSTTTVHEFGHHLGLSHPHDGYDAETGVDYGPSGSTFFAWSGDESNTIMSYLDLSTSFGQFDQDNMYRYEMAGYLNLSNNLIDDILAKPQTIRLENLLTRAETNAQLAKRNFDAWDYREAASHARETYTLVLEAAQQAGIDTSGDTFRIQSAPSDAGLLHKDEPRPFLDN